MNAQMKCLRQKLASISQIRNATYSTLACARQNILYPDGEAEISGDSTPICQPIDLALSHVDRNILAWKERCLPSHQPDKLSSGLTSGSEELCSPNLSLNAGNPDLYGILRKNFHPDGTFGVPPAANKESLLQSVSLRDLSINGTRPKLNLGSVEHDRFVCNTNILKSVTTKPCDDHGMYSSESNAAGRADSGGEKRDGPTQQHLHNVRQYYEMILPMFHKNGEDFQAHIHHENIVFENNYFKKPKVIRGLKNYATELFKIRFIASLVYTSILFEPRAAGTMVPRSDISNSMYDQGTRCLLLSIFSIVQYRKPMSITTHLSENCVKLHWRARIVSNWLFLSSWMPSLVKGNRSKVYDVLEGISTFTVNKDGQIIKHQLDRTVPLSEAEVNPAATKLAVKTASLIGFAPKTNFWSWFSGRRQ